MRPLHAPRPFPTRFPGRDARAARRAWERILLDPLLPSGCLHCGRIAAGPWWPHLCPACAGELRRPHAAQLQSVTATLAAQAAAHTPRLHALWVHGGPARSLLHALKYRGLTRIGRRLGRDLAMEAALARLPPGVVLVPVPLHPLRRWRRGHDQVRAIARGAREVVPWLRLVPALRRTRNTRSQVGLSVAARRANLAGAFGLRRRHRERLRGARVVLLDDVVTTGATLAAATRALGAVGARPERVLAAAVAPAVSSSP